jgi:coenzyme F420-reducing hydrogenase gamma subunit
MTSATVGIFGLTGCAGDQLVVLNCEDELLRLLELLEVRDFLMGSSDNDEECPLDIALVEGAVLSRRDEERLRRIRARSTTLVAIGTCAVWGGVAAMDRGLDRARLLNDVYGHQGRLFDTQAARALHEVVKVDLNITGCPIEKAELLSAISHLLQGNPPLGLHYPVCTECRIREQRCLLVEEGLPCLGPVTAAGCDARCPGYGVACVGCRGPAVDANWESLVALFEEKGLGPHEVWRKLKTFAPVALSAHALQED